MTMFRSSFDIDSAEQLAKKFGLEQYGRAQKALDNAVIRWSEKYTPWKEGLLATSPYAASDIGSGEIVYPGPYAHYQYYGEVYGPNIPVFDDDSGDPTGWFSPPGQQKHPTGRELKYNTDYNPLAGPHWIPRMAADHIDDIVAEVEAVALGGGKEK